MGTEGSVSSTYTSAQPELEITRQNDVQLQFKARYLYDFSPLRIGTVVLHPVFRYFWMGDRVAKPYEVTATTCRYSHVFKVKVYPDINWTLGVEYSNNKSTASFFGPEGAVTPPEGRWEADGDKEFKLSLEAAWDGEEETDLTANLTEKVQEWKEKSSGVIKWIMEVFLGAKNGETKPDQEKPRGRHHAALEEAKATYSRGRGTQSPNSVGVLARVDLKTLRRPLAGMDVIWPSLKADFSWSRVVNNHEGQAEVHRNQTGVMLEGTLAADPLIGLSFYLDFLALLQRAHPVALAIIAAIDLTLEEANEENKITVELRATGTVGLSLQGFLNTATGENSFNGADRIANERALRKVDGKIELSLLAQIDLQGKKDILFFTVSGEVELQVEAKAEWTFETEIDHNDSGFYLGLYSTFEGLEVVGKAKVEFQLGDKDSDESLFDIGGEADAKYQAIDPQEKQLLKKWGI